MGSRNSVEGPAPELPDRTPGEIADLEARNALLQFDLMHNLIEQAAASGKFRLRPSTLLKLNRRAVVDLVERPGTMRQGGVYIEGSDHTPPEPETCPELVDEMCEYVNEHWHEASALHLSAYVMWRLNWIHPFGDGNGRTSRAVSYLVLCAKLGYRLPGTRTVPELIAADKEPYYLALDAADAAWANGELDTRAMEELLQSLMAEILLAVVEDAKR